MILTTFWLSKCILWERAFLRTHGVPEAQVMSADGSYMARAFLKGWFSCVRRKQK